MMDRIYLQIGAMLLLQACVNCDVFSELEETNIINFVETTMSCRRIPGLTLSVVKGSKTWTRGFGLADIEKEIPVTPKTLFLIGSLGKAFTMTLLGVLLEKAGYYFTALLRVSNSYDWKTKIADIKELDLEFIEDEITREITIADMLSHDTGLSAVTDYGFIGGYPPNIDRKFISKRTKYIPKIKEFRKSFVYNNMMYALLGYLEELLGNDTWQNLVTSHLLEPLGMTSSIPLDKDGNIAKEGIARPYIMPNETFENGNYNIYRISPLEPAGGILSTAEDMAKWMRFNLNMGKTDDNVQLLNQSLFAEAFRNQNTLPIGGSLVSIKVPMYPVNDITSAYGYAWFTSRYRGRRKVWHSGGLFSYVSLIWLYPNEEAGVFISINGPGLPSSASNAQKTILYYISDLLLGQPTWLNLHTTCTFPKPWNNFSLDAYDTEKPPTNFTNNNLEQFVGIYGNMLLPDVKISLRNENMESPFLWFEMNRIKGELLLTADESEFQFKMAEPWEYAIERVITKYTVVTYPLKFLKNDTVYAFNLELSLHEVIQFRKDVRFDPLVNSTPSRTVEHSLLLLMVAIIAILQYNP